jgi:hypothetical protein
MSGMAASSSPCCRGTPRTPPLLPLQRSGSNGIAIGGRRLSGACLRQRCLRQQTGPETLWSSSPPPLKAGRRI